MHYPWWYVPYLTSPMLIAAIATIHVFTSMYAVGGGIVLAGEVSHAYKVNNKSHLDYLRSHAFFFILLTVVFGAITGVGIWWIIGLSSPLATESLIHVFVFGWAMEYVFFVLEIVSAFIFFYYWGRLAPRTHRAIGWIYAISAYMSLVLITGITAFQLDIGSWTPDKGMWSAFFNPQTFPQIVARTGASLLMASLYIYLHAAFKLKHDINLRSLVETRTATWSMVGAVLVTIGGWWWYVNLPESSKAALAGASALNVLTALVFAASAIVFFMLYFGPHRNPGWINPGFAILYFVTGIAATSAGEFIREGGVWTKAFVSSHYPQVIDPIGNIDSRRLLELPEGDQLTLGRVLFQYHCNDCHSERGFSGVSEYTRGWTEEMINTAVTHLDKAHYFMPPWCGTQEEAMLLTKFIKHISLNSPAGMRFSEEPNQSRYDLTHVEEGGAAK